MKRILGIFVVAALGAAISAGQITCNYTAPGIVAVPSSGDGGQVGGAANPANVTTIVANGTDAYMVSKVTIAAYLNHPRAADLLITLSHCGTTVTLFPTSQNPAASLNGLYTFNDSASTSFTTAVNQAPGIVPAGTYKPAQLLNMFLGQSASGPWTLTIADLAVGFSGTAGMVSVQITTGSSFGGSIFPSVPIPDGQNGIPGQPVTRIINVPSSARVGFVEATVGITHTYTSDLTVVLSHGGVSATIMSYNSPLSGANLGGNYTFDDEAPTSWAQTVGALGGSATVINGGYRPLSPFAAFRGLDSSGPWYLTVCDSGTGDTGVLSYFHLEIGLSNWGLYISQLNGPASVTLKNVGGAPGNTYANLVSFAAGAYPNGWLYGIDIGMDDIAYQVNFGAPFFGTLTPCGTASTTVLGPVPSNLTCWLTSLELDSSGSVVNVMPAFAYTTP